MPQDGETEAFPTPTKQPLLPALRVVHYEIDQMVRTILPDDDWALIAAFRECGTTITNALLESRLIHIRALLDFFQKAQRSKIKGEELDDVLSKDFGYQAAPIDIDPVYLNRLNKDLAHITYARIERAPESKKWPLRMVELPILKRCDEFIGFLVTSELLSGEPQEVFKWQSLRRRIQDKVALISRAKGPKARARGTTG
jgi:hypothetical protein